LEVEKRRSLFIVVALFGGALVVRWVAILQNPVLANDAVFYIKLARLYSSGDYVAAFKLYPYSLFPLLIASFHEIWGDWVLAGQWVSALCGALTVIPIYLLARRIFDEKIALWAAIFYSISPHLVRYSAEVLRDMPFILFYIFALWSGYLGIKDAKMLYLALSSVFVYLTTLIRVEGLLLFIVLPVYFIWHGARESLSLRRTAIALTILFLFFPVLVSPLGILFSKKGGRLNLAQLQAVKVHFMMSVSNQTIENVEQELEKGNLFIYGRNFFELARKHRFVLYISHIAYKTVKVFTVPLFLLFLLGLLRRKKVGYQADEFLLVAVYGVFVFTFLLYLNSTNYFSTRHPFPVVVPALIWCGVGFEELRERLILWIKGRDFPLRRQALRCLIPLLLLLICVPLLSMAWAPQRKNKLELKEIGLWLKNNGYAHSSIAAQGEFTRLVFYADGVFILLPKGTYQDIMRFAREKEANLLVINEKTIDHFSPNFSNSVSSRDLQRIHIRGIKTPQYGTLVFRVKELEEKE
jgi:hypothetical protein